MLTYGGDEVNAIVLDMGRSMTKMGYAGETCPKVFVPTLTGRTPGSKAPLVGEGAMHTWQRGLELRSPFDSEGQLANWDVFEELLETAYRSHLRVAPADHPLLVAEPAWHTAATRETIAEIAFEKLGIQAFYLAKAPVLSAMATGRHTALVLDVGAGWASATPVFEGYVLKRSKTVQVQPLAGDAVSREALAQWASLDIDAVPQYQVAAKFPANAGEPAPFARAERPDTSDSFHEAQVARLAHEFKETCCQVAEARLDDEAALAALPARGFEFPSGYNRLFGAERFTVPEVLFRPEKRRATADADAMQTDAATVPKLDGLHTMVSKAIDACDIDIRHLLAQNVLVTGGTSLMPGLLGRLQYELDANRHNLRVKVNAPANWVERRFSTWIGGSILASLGTFHQMWISRAEYGEHGKGVVEKRCL